MKEEKNALQKIDEEGAKEIRLADGVLEKLDADQMKFCQYSVYTDMDRQEVADLLGVSKRKLTMWERDPYVSAYLTYLKKKSSASVVETFDKVNKLIVEKASMEMLSRFEEPDRENDLDEDAAEWEQKQYDARFWKNATAKDAGDFYLKLQKSVRESDKGGGLDQDEQLIQMVRTRHHRQRLKKREMLDKFKEAGVDMASFFDIDVLDMNSEGRWIKSEDMASQVVDMETVEIETFSILRKGKVEDE